MCGCGCVCVCLCVCVTSHKLSILHMIVYRSKLLAQFIPTFSFPSVLTSPISTSAIGSSVSFFQISYICINIGYFFTLGLTDSRFIHFVTMIQFHSFIWLSSISLSICTTSSLSRRLSMDTGWFPVLSIVNSAAMNMEVHASF